MNSRNKKWWILLGGIPFLFLILVLSSVDLSPWLKPTREKKGLPIQVSASAAVRELDVPLLTLERGRHAVAHRGGLDPSMVEGYVAPGEGIPEAAPEKASSSYPYSVLIASCRNPRNAERVMAACREKGYAVYSAKTDLRDRGIWTRVFAGCFGSLEGALAFIRSEGLEGAVPVKTRYANLVGSFQSRMDLREPARRLADAGYSPYFIEDPQGACRLYTGAFESRDAVEQQAAALAAAGIACRPVRR